MYCLFSDCAELHINSNLNADSFLTFVNNSHENKLSLLKSLSLFAYFTEYLTSKSLSIK